jgi:hypothetical protein
MNTDAAGPSSPRPSTASQGKRAVPVNPALRFQRRQSERAYLEDSYRDGSTFANQNPPSSGIMDYSAAEHAGSSPWANSPEASRQSFGDANISRENLPPPAQEGVGERDGGEQREGGWGQAQQQQWQAGEGQRGSAEENRRPQSAARYHAAPPQQQQQQQRHPAPQYKLQAKITALERSGKKDAIVRFDVYVYLSSSSSSHYPQPPLR